MANGERRNDDSNKPRDGNEDEQDAKLKTNEDGRRKAVAATDS